VSKLIKSGVVSLLATVMLPLFLFTVPFFRKSTAVSADASHPFQPVDHRTDLRAGSEALLRKIEAVPGAAPLVEELLSSWRSLRQVEIAEVHPSLPPEPKPTLRPLRSEELDRRNLEKMIQEAKIEEVWNEIREVTQNQRLDLPEHPWDILPGTDSNNN
jgi:hypothetical protein